ncbi:MAG: glycosyltransferase family 2 protein [Oscillospiraceae bacterium]
MKEYRDIAGVPNFDAFEYGKKSSEYILLIPIINEGERIAAELERAKSAGISQIADIVLCDGGSSDGSTDETTMRSMGVKSVLVKRGPGKQGAQLRTGIWWALEHGYEGIITIDGNNKDSIESVPLFIEKLKEGFDFIQGSRFIQGGEAVNTPMSRHLAVRFIHAPIISLTAHFRFTDTTSAFRGHSRRYLEDDRVQPLRDIFSEYELLAYLSVRWSKCGYSACEVPVKREYPKNGKTPTKISPIKGNWQLLKVLFKNAFGKYNPQ